MNVNLCIAFSHAKCHGVFAASLFHQLLRHIISKNYENDQRQKSGYQEAENRGGLLVDVLSKGGTALIQAVSEIRVIHKTGFVNFFIVLVGKDDLVIFHFYFTDVFVIDHAHEGTVIGFFYLMLHQDWGNHQIKDDQHQKHNAVIVDQRLFWGFYFFHGCSPFLCKLVH